MIIDVTTCGAAPGMDSTVAIQGAIDKAGPGDTVFIPPFEFMVDALKGSDGYGSGGLFLKSNMTLALSSGAILRAIPNVATHYTIVTLRGIENVKVVGPGAIIGDRDTHPDIGTSQFGFGIAMMGGSKNIVVQNLPISKLWGDGLTILDASKVLIDQVTTDSCKRQNMSLISAQEVSITNSIFKNAWFSALDLEADIPSQTISSVLVKGCMFLNSNMCKIGQPVHIGVGSKAGTYKGIVIDKDNIFDLRMQPIFAHDNAGETGVSWWAFLRNRIFYQWLHVPTYKFEDYPQSWSSKT